MSANMTGMDIEQVRQFAQMLSQKADEIRTLTAQLTSKLGGTTWQGPDATRFRSDWQSTHVRNLNSVVEALTHASQAATSDAQQQQDASS